MLANETEEKKQEIWNTVTDQAKQRFVEKDTGRIKLANEAICIVGSSINSKKKFKNSVTAKNIKAQTIKDLNIHAIFSCCSILSVRKLAVPSSFNS